MGEITVIGPSATGLTLGRELFTGVLKLVARAADRVGHFHGGPDGHVPVERPLAERALEVWCDASKPLDGFYSECPAVVRCCTEQGGGRLGVTAPIEEDGERRGE